MIPLTTLLGNRSLVYVKRQLSDDGRESKYQGGNGTILNIMGLNVCYYCTEQLAFKAITSVSCTSSISQSCV